MSAKIEVFGIRHHGPGSARSLLYALTAFEPDAVLVEGPPDAEAVLHFLQHPKMQPPVSLLVYAKDTPRLAAYYPMTFFSPEYQAIRYALQQQVTLRMMDLPQAISLPKFVRPALESLQADAESATAAEKARIPQPLPDDQPLSLDEHLQDETGDAETEETAEAAQRRIQEDPLSELARVAGYKDGERWWDHMIEQRRDHQDAFAAVLEAMTELRDAYAFGILDPEREALREAYMRQVIRQAITEGHQRIAVVCGAWHAPVLHNMAISETDDHAALASLESIAVESTWIPWTNTRLVFNSGYGAGIRAPGWYQFLWENAEHNVAVHWLTKVSKLLRDAGQNASPAETIDAVRLAETLAAIRGRPLPDLHDMNEAALAVLCHGNATPMRMIQEQLIVGDAIGRVPDETPMVPLQRDLERQQQQLGLRQHARESTLSLDQRKDTHLAQSYLLHRLCLLGVDWGKKVDVSAFAGTYKEVWKLNWTPELTIRLIEQSAWGNTIAEAAQAFAISQATNAKDLPALTNLVHQTLLSDLPEAVTMVVRSLKDRASLTKDLIELMHALPPLAQVMVYNDVRNTQADTVREIITRFLRWIHYELPVYCGQIDDNAARSIKTAIQQCHMAVQLLDETAFGDLWYATLEILFQQAKTNGIINGLAARLLLDERQVEIDTVLQHFGYIASFADEVERVAGFLEGFLSEKGLILVHDDQLLRLLDDWVVRLQAQQFEALVPLLRRTFMTFQEHELRQIARRVMRLSKDANTTDEAHTPSAATLIDQDHAATVLDTFAELLSPSNSENDDHGTAT